MKIVGRFDYRFASAVLHDPSFDGVVEDLATILESTLVPVLDIDPKAPKRRRMKMRERKPLKADGRDRFVLFPVDQTTLNSQIDSAFSSGPAANGWDRHPLVVPATGEAKAPKLAADYRRQRVQIEIQFGNAARWYADVFKFQMSYSLDVIDAAILVVPMKDLANFIDDNISHFERVTRELPAAKLSLTVPILVLGVEPESWARIKLTYDGAATLRELPATAKSLGRVRIPFEARRKEIQSETLTTDSDAT